MKKFNIISALIMGVVLFSVPCQAETSVSARVTTDLNVRQYPNKDAKIIDVLPEGAVIEAYDSGNTDWNKVKFSDYIGYVYNAYLEAADDPIPLNARESSGMAPSSPTSAPQVINGSAAEETPRSNEKTLTKVIPKDDFIQAGILNWNGWNWTYYLMRQFPGSTSTPCPGRYVNSEGFVCDPDGYIILASADLAPYTVVETPFGYMGKVYDTGCPSGYLDVYTDW